MCVAFRPKAYIITNPDRPRSITICAITNCGRYREILLDGLTETDYLSYVTKEANNQERLKKLFEFFGEAVDFRINYTYDLSKTYDMKGNPVGVGLCSHSHSLIVVEILDCSIQVQRNVS